MTAPTCCNVVMDQKLDCCIWVCSMCGAEVLDRDRYNNHRLEQSRFLSSLHPLVQLDRELRYFGAQ